MSSTDDIARLNLGGADSTALAEVITEYWDEGAAPFEESKTCLHSFKPHCLYNMHQSNTQ